MIMALMNHAADQLADLVALIRHGKNMLSIAVAIKDGNGAPGALAIKSSLG